MAKNLKRQPAAVRPNVTAKSAQKSRVNGHGLAHDDGLPASDDFEAAPETAAAAVEEDDAAWTDEERKIRTAMKKHRVDATDDPVRMYLMQMGQIPLLNRGRGNRLRQADRKDAPPLSP